MASNRIVHKFVAGIPSYTKAAPDRKAQGEVAIEKEVQDEEYHDLIMAPHRDYYQDLSLKRLAILKWGVENKCKYTVKVDDEYCVNVTKLQRAISKYEQQHGNSEEERGLYLGIFL
jgi:hypothetical protein